MAGSRASPGPRVLREAPSSSNQLDAASAGLLGDAALRRSMAGLTVDGARSAGPGVTRLAGLLSRAYAPSTNRNDAGHWRAWERVCARLGTSPWRVDMAANSGADPVGYHEECYLLGIALIMFYDEMKPRSRTATLPRTLAALCRSCARCAAAIVRGGPPSRWSR